MIDIFLEELKERVNSYLNQQLTVSNPSNNNIVVGDISRKETPIVDNSPDTDNSKICLTLVNIEEETTLKNNYPVRKEGSSFIKEQSAVYINVYLLFSSNYENYSEGVKQLSRVIQFFQFNKKMSLFINETIEVRLNLHNIGFENLNNLWTVLGGRYLPSVMYKARLLLFQETPPISGPAIIDIEGTETLN